MGDTQILFLILPGPLKHKKNLLIYSHPFLNHNPNPKLI